VSNEQVRQREENLEALIRLGVDPYPYHYEVTHHAAQVEEGFESLEHDGSSVSLAGRLMTIRGHGKSTFAHLQDKTGRIQVYFKLDILGEKAYEVVRLLDLGDLVGVKGTLFRTRTGEITVEVHEPTFLAKCLTPLPEKWHGLKDMEIRYRQRYLDLLVNQDTRRIFEVRASLIRSLRASLDEMGYLEVDTPVLQPVYGGAFARPFVTGHEALGMDFYLRISNELYLKRLIVGGLERVYEIARDFRNEGIDRTHNPEFSMLEYYQAYADYDEMMGVTEKLVARAIKDATGGYQVAYGEHTIDFTPPWRRMRYFDALGEAIGADLTGVDEARVREAAGKLGIDLEGKVGLGQAIDEIFSETVEANLIQPVFITDFPIELSPLAKKHRESEEVVERFELFAAGIELANAFSEQNDPAAQAQAFERQQELREEGDLEAQVTDNDYLRALRLGMPPTGGVGIGIDRLVMLANGAANIREVILFPQLRSEGGEPVGDADTGGDTAEDETAETRA
jgi:lysyl-tRNA synthetase class 2